MAHVPDLEPQKRKRGPDDTGTHQPPGHHQQAMSFPQGNPGDINYLSSLLTERLSLIQGDTDTFSDILSLVAEYEGVLERHESLAANLGAKLTGPRLVKGIEKFFEGPIKTHPPHPYPSVSWLDVCTFAKSKPEDFTLTSLLDGSRCCQFVCKGLQVEICEDDWRFISSGALNRLPLEHPLEEDEVAEMATLDILDQRTSFLYRKADEVAARARILHHKIGLRKQDMSRRRQAPGDSESGSGSRFQSVNQPFRAQNQVPPYDVHQDLLQQFLAATSATSHSRSTSVARLSQGQASPSLTSSQPQRPPGPSRSGTSTGTEPETHTDAFRPLITQTIDKLARNEIIYPPCDRCRRLKQQCLKHLTACVGCTKKHAKCSWKTATEEEVASLRQELGGLPERPVEMETETELTSPSSGQSFARPVIDATLGRSASAEMSRPASRGVEDPGGPAAFMAHNILSSRQELPMIRSRTSLPSGQGAGSNAPITPLSQSSASQMGSERPGWGTSNPPSR